MDFEPKDVFDRFQPMSPGEASRLHSISQGDAKALREAMESFDEAEETRRESLLEIISRAKAGEEWAIGFLARQHSLTIFTDEECREYQKNAVPPEPTKGRRPFIFRQGRGV